MNIGFCKRRKADQAFALTEVMMGTCVLGVTLAGLYTGVAQGFRIVSSVREERRATQILVQATETLRLYTWEQVHDASFLPHTFTVPFDPESTNSSFTYTGTIQVEDAPTSTESYRSNMCKVTLTLDWRSGELNRERQVTTLVSSNGLYTYVTAAH